MSQVVFTKTNMLTDAITHYCPGCGHGIVHRLVAESIEELGMNDRAVGISPVGCAVFAYRYFNCDNQVALHGRAPAVATGIKRVSPEAIVFTYQGDGDLASIGNAEVNHAAARGEKFVTILVNNGIYGMTGGQMAPTTLIGQKATTSPQGRSVERAGFPMKVAEMIATHEGVQFCERVAVNNTANILKAKKAIKKAFQNQVDGKGFNFIEVLSTCPTNWGLDAIESMKWVEEKMIPYYPLGVLKDKDQEAK
ncbi:MAG: 2-oxoglutarate oxidoreductase [Deltaproteobacteria bacterium]|jgi:2-oxoglutarate ferredoxin oxidoreductase subunit beta|nr:2-oxoglutarate oxidoreductase [Deltaproteobacteria bacterium]